MLPVAVENAEFEATKEIYLSAHVANISRREGLSHHGRLENVSNKLINNSSNSESTWRTVRVGRLRFLPRGSFSAVRPVRFRRPWNALESATSSENSKIKLWLTTTEGL